MRGGAYINNKWYICEIESLPLKHCSNPCQAMPYLSRPSSLASFLHWVAFPLRGHGKMLVQKTKTQRMLASCILEIIWAVAAVDPKSENCSLYRCQFPERLPPAYKCIEFFTLDWWSWTPVIIVRAANGRQWHIGKWSQATCGGDKKATFSWILGCKYFALQFLGPNLRIYPCWPVKSWDSSKPAFPGQHWLVAQLVLTSYQQTAQW